MVEDALRFFDKSGAGNGGDRGRYVLDAFVLMPNHVHLLMIPLPDHPPAQIMHSLKSFTAHEINKRIGRCGRVWMEERFDHLVRNREQLEKFRLYIRENPGAAGLPEGAFTVGRGSGIR